eukprot:Nk52_evm41s2391 gene=Nk52_evmTU41s2391
MEKPFWPDLSFDNTSKDYLCTPDIFDEIKLIAHEMRTGASTAPGTEAAHIIKGQNEDLLMDEDAHRNQQRLPGGTAVANINPWCTATNKSQTSRNNNNVSSYNNKRNSNQTHFAKPNMPTIGIAKSCNSLPLSKEKRRSLKGIRQATSKHSISSMATSIGDLDELDDQGFIDVASPVSDNLAMECSPADEIAYASFARDWFFPASSCTANNQQNSPGVVPAGPCTLNSSDCASLDELHNCSYSGSSECCFLGDSTASLAVVPDEGVVGGNRHSLKRKPKTKTKERNRQAALKCRQKKNEFIGTLKEQTAALNIQNLELQKEYNGLREEVAQLKAVLLMHSKCFQTKGLPDSPILKGDNAKQARGEEARAAGKSISTASTLVL